MACLSCVAVYAQTRMPAAPLLNGDLAVLETPEPRNDLNCSVAALKPYLGFDLRFHTGYGVGVPAAGLAHTRSLVMLFRVTGEKQNNNPVYFSQISQIPDLDENSTGVVPLQGEFDLGEGKYRVDWLLRDSAGHLCSQHWQLDATLPARDRDLSLAIAPGAEEASDEELFRPEPPPPQAPESGLAVKVLVNFAPQNEDAVTLQPAEMFALISILRDIAREPSIARISLVAFNLRDRRILYRRENSARIDFPALGQAVQAPTAGTIDVQALGRKHGDTGFLTQLIGQEMNGGARTDALIFAGLKVALDDRVPAQSLRRIGDPGFPIFYLNFNADPLGNPWRDTIGEVVKFFKGLEYTISRPQDLGFAWQDILSRVRMAGRGQRASR